MKKPIRTKSTGVLRAICLAVLGCLLAVPTANANILSSARISLVETYRDRLVTEKEEGEIYRDVEATPQTLVARIEANLVGTNIHAFNAETEFSVILGGFFITGTLGDDPQYKPGRKNAMFPLGDWVELNNGRERFKRVGSVRLNWNARKLIVVITCSDIDFIGASEVGASTYTELAAPGRSVVGNGESILVSVEMGDAAGETELNARVTSKTAVRKFWMPDYEDFEEFFLYSVTLEAGTRIPSGPLLDGVVTSDDSVPTETVNAETD